jgi:ankyrin repeat protein
MDSSTHSKNQYDLFDAAKNGQTETIKALIAAPDVFINAKDSDGYTLLMLAVEGGHNETVKFLLTIPDVLINDKDNYGYTALMVAAENGHNDTVKILLNAPGILIDTKDTHKDTALILAARNHHLSVVKLLVHANASLYAVNINNSSALAEASRHRDYSIFFHLASCSNKATINHILNSAPPEVHLEEMFTQYFENKYKLKYDTFKAIYQMQQHKTPQINPLTEVLMIKIFSFLLPDWYRTDQFPAMYKKQKQKAIKVQHKIELNNWLLDGAQNHDINYIDVFIKEGARISYTKKGKSALKLALERDYATATDILIKLIAFGADVNTELTLAIEHGNIAVIKQLMLAGIDVNKNLHNAIQNGHINIVKTLIQAGVDLNAVDKSGYPALKIALNSKQYKIILLLLSTKAKSLYTEFKKQPAYTLFSGATRLLIGALVGYGMFYGLTAMAAPYLTAAAANQLTNIATATIWSLTNLLPKVITAVSAIAALFASTKIGDIFLSRFFGEIKIVTELSYDAQAIGNHKVTTNTKITKGLLTLLGQHRPYVTPVSEITKQIENGFNEKNRYDADLLPKSKTLAFVYTREFVNADQNQSIFNTNARAEVNEQPYLSAMLSRQF